MIINDEGTWNNVALGDRLDPFLVSKLDPSSGDTIKIIEWEPKGIQVQGSYPVFRKY